jgi:pyruvyltransferase
VHVDALHHHRYLAIGSILGSANEWSRVWGSGFIREGELVQGPPRSVHAVRGPLSRQALLKQGIKCPEIYGDPALLLPRFFKPVVEQRHRIGIVPHYIDKSNPVLAQFVDSAEVTILDIESGLEEFVRSMSACSVVLSSSLHGLICAHAYGIPAAWISLSEKVIGGSFKFRDYGASVGIDDIRACRVTSARDVMDTARAAERLDLQIDLRALFLACPFLSDDLRREAGSSGDDLPEMFQSRNFAGGLREARVA